MKLFGYYIVKSIPENRVIIETLVPDKSKDAKISTLERTIEHLRHEHVWERRAAYENGQSIERQRLEQDRKWLEREYNYWEEEKAQYVLEKLKEIGR